LAFHENLKKNKILVLKV